MALSAAEAYVTGLAPYLQLALQNRQRQQELGLQGQQIAQTGAFQQGQLANTAQQLAQQREYQQQQVNISQQQLRTQALEVLTRAAQADPLNMTGVMSKAEQYVNSLGFSPQELKASAGIQSQAQPQEAPGQGFAAGQTQMPAPPQPQGLPAAPAAAPSGGIGDGLGALSQALQSGATGQELLNAMPIPLANQVKGILSGQVAPPTLTTRNPVARQLLMLAQQVDPSFDATQYGQRYSTARAFTSGQQGNAIRAVNQTMQHAAHLLDNINQLGNYGGIFPGLVNTVGNYVGEHVLGQSTQQNFEQTVGALASELRKVFAAAGGGSLTELKSWEDNFPLNASPEQQRSYLKNGMSLLRGAINALQEQYRRGFGATANVESLLSPQARQALDYISNMDPKTGKTLTAAPQGGGNAPPAAIQYLRAHPEMAPAFKAKYGYLPGG